MKKFAFKDSWKTEAVLIFSGAIYVVFLSVVLLLSAPVEPKGPPGALFRVPFCLKKVDAFLYSCPSPAASELSETLIPLVTIYEDDKPLGPRAPLDDIRKLGAGRFAYSKTAGLFISPSNNDTVLSQNHHDYWVVLPQ
jgi:hypothetical protein